MKIYYGCPGNYIDVTDIAKSMGKYGSVSIKGHYNDIFGDVCIGRAKHLRIDHPRLLHPVYVKEDTDIDIDLCNTGIITIPINVVYFLNTRVNKGYIHLVRAQLEHLKRLGLVSVCRLYVEVVVEKDTGDKVIGEILSIVPTAIIHVYEEDYFEYHGIYRVWQLSQSDPNNMTLYFHSKGISHISNPTPDNCRHPVEIQMYNICIDNWIQNLAIMSIFPSIDKLGHSVGTSGWIWHNFWWARGSYLARCEEPLKTRRRHYYEDWISRKTHYTLPYSNIERSITNDNYDISISNCFGCYSNNRELPINIGEVMDPLTPCYDTNLCRKPLLKIDTGLIGRGLFNQINSLIDSIVLASNTKRNIYLPHMCPDMFNTEYRVPWSDIIDMKSLDTLDIDIIHECTDTVFHRHRYRDSLCLEYRFSMSDIIADIQVDVLDLDIGWCTFSPSGNEVYNRILRSIRPTKKYEEVVNYCISDKEYNVVHLRVEEDWIGSCMCLLNRTEEDVTQSIWTMYLNSMKKMFRKDDHIHICTYLTKNDDKNNWMIEELKKLYPNIRLTPKWRKKFDLPCGREIDAIIDYMIAIRGRKFLGYTGSTFSMAIDSMMKTQDRETTIIAIQ